MSEILFYHLERQNLEQVLPLLLEKTLERGWRAVVQASSPERVEALSSLLWTWRDESFLPHASAKEGNADEQPIWLCTDDENPNNANVRFCVDGSKTDSYDELERTIYMFDGNDPDAVEDARAIWRKVKETDHSLTYWRQNEHGQWKKNT